MYGLLIKYIENNMWCK